jgi:hypothetical protein
VKLTQKSTLGNDTAADKEFIALFTPLKAMREVTVLRQMLYSNCRMCYLMSVYSLSTMVPSAEGSRII